MKDFTHTDENWKFTVILPAIGALFSLTSTTTLFTLRSFSLLLDLAPFASILSLALVFPFYEEDLLFIQVLGYQVLNSINIGLNLSL